MKKNLLVFSACVFALLFSFVSIAHSGIDDSLRTVVCCGIFKALGKVAGNSADARAILNRGLMDKDFFIRAYAAEALGSLGDTNSVPVLKKLTRDESYLVRINATTALIRLGAYTEDSLLDFLKDSKPEIRGNILGQLASFGAKYLELISKTLQDDKNDFVREQAILRLGENKFGQAHKEIVMALESKNLELRQAACFALGQINGPDAAGLLQKQLGDSEPKVRASAKEALSVLADRSIIELLWQDLKEENEFLRGTSFTALANLKELDVLPVALKEITSTQATSYTRAKAATALMIMKPYVSELSDKALASLNIGALSADNLEFNFEYKINGQGLAKVLIDAINDAKNPLHKDAALIVGIMQEKDCLPALRQALLLDEPDMAASAAYTLGKMNDDGALEYLLQVCKKYGCGKV